MAVITISRQNGSLGDEIANALASRLGTMVISRKYALENFYGKINPGTLDRLNESAKFPAALAVKVSPANRDATIARARTKLRMRFFINIFSLKISFLGWMFG